MSHKPSIIGANQSPGPVLRILHLEDNVVDAELIQSNLQAGGIGCVIRRVETRADFEAEVERRRCDLIISDQTLPSFDGLSALQIARQKCPEIPFIFVSYPFRRSIVSLKRAHFRA